MAGVRENQDGSAVPVVEAALAHACESVDLGAFWGMDEEGALGQAADLDRLPGGHELPLAGTTVAVKDLFDLAGVPTTAGLAGERAAADTDAGLVRRLRSAGAVPIGKTAMDPLGLTTGGQAAGFPTCFNPVDSSLSPGGSSSGSAVAVAAGITSAGLGTDTAGSLRIPAAYCGIVALKPALGRLRRSGMVEVMGRWDLPGAMAPTVPACISVFEVLSGRPRQRPGRGHLRIGLLSDLFAGSDPEVRACCEQAAWRLGADFKLEPVELGWDAKGFGLVLACEFEALWGERVDHDPERFPGLAAEMVSSARKAGPAGFAAVSSALAGERDRVGRRLGGFDAFLSPTVPVPAPDREQESVAVSTRFTRIFSALGWPALSLPAGEARGRPIGIQVSALPSRFDEMLEVAVELELALA